MKCSNPHRLVVSASQSSWDTCTAALYTSHRVLFDCMDSSKQFYAAIPSQPYHCAILDNGRGRSRHLVRLGIPPRIDALGCGHEIWDEGQANRSVYLWRRV